MKKMRLVLCVMSFISVMPDRSGASTSSYPYFFDLSQDPDEAIEMVGNQNNAVGLFTAPVPAPSLVGAIDFLSLDPHNLDYLDCSKDLQVQLLLKMPVTYLGQSYAITGFNYGGEQGWFFVSTPGQIKGAAYVVFPDPGYYTGNSSFNITVHHAPLQQGDTGTTYACHGSNPGVSIRQAIQNKNLSALSQLNGKFPWITYYPQAEVQAALNDDVTTLDWLIANGGAPDFTTVEPYYSADSNGGGKCPMSPLSYALYYDRPDAAIDLIQKGANPNIGVSPVTYLIGGNTPLNLVCTTANNVQWPTALALALRSSSSDQIVNALQKVGAKLVDPTKPDMTAIYIACSAFFTHLSSLDQMKKYLTGKETLTFNGGGIDRDTCEPITSKYWQTSYHGKFLNELEIATLADDLPTVEYLANFTWDDKALALSKALRVGAIAGKSDIVNLLIDTLGAKPDPETVSEVLLQWSRCSNNDWVFPTALGDCKTFPYAQIFGKLLSALDHPEFIAPVAYTSDAQGALKAAIKNFDTGSLENILIYMAQISYTGPVQLLNVRLDNVESILHFVESSPGFTPSIAEDIIYQIAGNPQTDVFPASLANTEFLLSNLLQVPGLDINHVFPPIGMLKTPNTVLDMCLFYNDGVYKTGDLLCNMIEGVGGKKYGDLPVP